MNSKQDVKQFNTLSVEEIGGYFQEKGYQNNKPLLLSFDGDKTIVDRDRGAHFMSPAVVDMFKKLKSNSQFLVSMNTGRDATNYLPLSKQTGHQEPNIFLSGRVVVHSGKSFSHPKARFSDELKKILWKHFIEGIVPFLDIKYSKGNVFFVKSSRGLEKYYGHHRPKGWFDELEKEIIDLDTNQRTKEIYDTMDIVRAEIPVLHSKQTAEIFSAINKEQREVVNKYAIEQLELMDSLDLLFVPVPTKKDQPGLREKIASIRVLVHDKYVNKGIGLKILAQLLKIPVANTVYFGDSAEDKANDATVKQVLPSCTLIITDNGEEEAKKFADFVVDPVGKDGVPKAVDRLIAFQNKYSGIPLN